MVELTDEELEIIRLCLEVVIYGPFLLCPAEDDPWIEFRVLMGLSPAEVVEIAEFWPKVNFDDRDIQRAVNNAMLLLMGYPHHCEVHWSDYFPVPPPMVYQILKKWRRLTSQTDGRSSNEFFNKLML